MHPPVPPSIRRDYDSWALEQAAHLRATGLPRSTWRTSPRRWRTWQRPRAGAAAESNLPLGIFPASCPYTRGQAMDEAFWAGCDQPQP